MHPVWTSVSAACVTSSQRVHYTGKTNRKQRACCIAVSCHQRRTGFFKDMRRWIRDFERLFSSPDEIKTLKIRTRQFKCRLTNRNISKTVESKLNKFAMVARRVMLRSAKKTRGVSALLLSRAVTSSGWQTCDDDDDDNDYDYDDNSDYNDDDDDDDDVDGLFWCWVSLVGNWTYRVRKYANKNTW
jgi:hypothetical protein